MARPVETGPPSGPLGICMRRLMSRRLYGLARVAGQGPIGEHPIEQPRVGASGLAGWTEARMAEVLTDFLHF